jgi:hypothetical protein
MWCPACRSEYRDGFTTCSDCGSPLVAKLSDGAHASPPDPEPPTNLPELTNDDVLAELETVPAVQADVVTARLRGEGIPAVAVGIDTSGYGVALRFTEGTRVMVRQADLERARAVLRELGEQDRNAPLTDDELAALAESATYDDDPRTGAV